MKSPISSQEDFSPSQKSHGIFCLSCFLKFCSGAECWKEPLTTKIQGTTAIRTCQGSSFTLSMIIRPLKLCSLQPVWLYKTILFSRTIFIYCTGHQVSISMKNLMTLRSRMFYYCFAFFLSLSPFFCCLFLKHLLFGCLEPKVGSLTSFFFFLFPIFYLTILLSGKFPQLYLPLILLMFYIIYLFSEDPSFCSLNVSFLKYTHSSYFSENLYLIVCMCVCAWFSSLCNLLSVTCFYLSWLLFFIIQIYPKCLFVFDRTFSFKRGH